MKNDLPNQFWFSGSFSWKTVHLNVNQCQRFAHKFLAVRLHDQGRIIKWKPCFEKVTISNSKWSIILKLGFHFDSYGWIVYTVAWLHSTSTLWKSQQKVDPELNICAHIAISRPTIICPDSTTVFINFPQNARIFNAFSPHFPKSPD